MNIALSSRLWELPDRYSIDQMQHLEIAAVLGYAGVELRYPLLPQRKETKRDEPVRVTT